MKNYTQLTPAAVTAQGTSFLISARHVVKMYAAAAVTFCLLLLLLHPASAQPLTGTKTIGGASPDYADFAAAVTALNNNGVGTGGVTFNFRDGTYSGGVAITATGTASNPIVFQSESDDASKVTISHSTTTVISLQGCSYITFNELTIDYTGSNARNALRILAGYGNTNNNDDVNVTNCILDGSSANTNDIANYCVILLKQYLSTTHNNNFVLTNCIVQNGSCGIYTEPYPGNHETGYKLKENEFKNNYAGGIWAIGHDAIMISGNTIHTNRTYNGTIGIYIESCIGKHQITNNYIYTDGSGQIQKGIEISNSSSTPGNNTLIANNSIQLYNGSDQCSGIYQPSDCKYYDIYNNTIYISGGSGAANELYHCLTSSDGTRVKNNIFINNGTHTYCNIVYIEDASGVSDIDNNCYYWSQSPYFRAKYVGVNYTSFSSYIAATGETNSLNIDPQMVFTPGVGWKATASQLMGAGEYLSSVPKDIDGVTRSNPPSIGAHELAPPCAVPTITLGSNPAVCYSVAGQNANLTYSATTGTPTTYSISGWSGGSFSNVTDAALPVSPIVIAVPAGTIADTYTATLTVKNACGNTSTNYSISVTVNAAPAAPTALAGTGALVNQFTANWNSVSGATAYILDVATDNAFNSLVSGYNGLNVGNVLTKTVTGLPPGPVTYYYRVRATNGSCTGNNSNTITYSTLAPGACPDLIGGTATPQYSIICSGGTKQLTVTGASGGSLQWQVSSDNISWGDISGATSATYNTAAAGTKKYYRCLTKNSSCFDAASTTAVVEVSNPTITVNVTGKTNNSVTLDWIPVGGGNYNINYDGASSGSGSSVTPPYTISGLTASGNYNITVTQTGLSCSASGTLTGVKTLCAVPTGVTLSSPANKQLKVDWTGGAGDYRVYYRALAIQNAYSYKDVTTTGNSGTTTISVMYSVTYEVYVVRKDCPTPGVFGQKSALAHTTVKPLSACTPAPTINEVKSTCPGQIEVSMSGSPTGKYVVFIQRLTPTVAGAYKYNVNGGTFQIHVGQPGQTFLVGVASKCNPSGTSDWTIYPGGITIKPLCNPIGNLVLSHATCNGFTASWNREICSENQVSTYQLFMKKTGTLTWNSYPVSSPVAPISPFLKVKWLGKGYEMNCYVKANYICNGYVIGGPSSTVQTITTLSAGCREEGEEMLTPETPSTQIIAADNSEAISIYPNPNSGQFQLDISRMSNDQQQVMIEVMNVLGQTILTRISEVKDGHGNEIITLPETTAAGTYFVRVTVGSNTYTAKVNVSR